MRGVRMPPELEAAIDAWIEQQPDPKPSRSEAIRSLIEIGLNASQQES
jgi:Arc/MetJ-type ribon-helix-helix transcriptional regulator